MNDISIFLGIHKILWIQSSDTNQIKKPKNMCSMFIITMYKWQWIDDESDFEIFDILAFFGIS